ncbi:MAG TPA: DUF3592 domain-containing protein [Afifellaceae bacterium]|nr:DUF3592 domain-containing protein [Afifellaceae bacterium]
MCPGKTEPPEGALSDRKFRIFSRLFRWLGIAAVGFAAFLLVSNIVFWIRAVSAVGIVTRQEVMKHTGSPSVYREPAYAPVITFQTAGGETVEVISDVGFGEHFAYTDGDEVSLLYLSSDPQSARIRSIFELIGLPVVLAGLGFVFWVVGIFAQFMSEMSARQAERMARRSR